MESAKLAFIVLAAVVVLLGLIVAAVWKLKPECFHRLKLWICRHALKCKDDHKRDTTSKATEIETGNGKVSYFKSFEYTSTDEILVRPLLIFHVKETRLTKD